MEGLQQRENISQASSDTAYIIYIYIKGEVGKEEKKKKTTHTLAQTALRAAHLKRELTNSSYFTLPPLLKG